MTLTDIVIVNWNSGCQLADCLTSIEEHGKAHTGRVIVVDNGSNDGSADALEGRLRLPLKVWRNVDNRGFAAACNQGATLAESPFILFLNPDTKLFEGALEESLAAFHKEENADVGIIGVQLVDEERSIGRTCSRFPTLSRLVVQATGVNKVQVMQTYGMPMKEWSHQCNAVVDQVMGAFFMVRRDVFEALYGFDERFFVYFEEVDFSYRARKAGWKSLYLSDAQIFHAGGGTTRKIKATRLFYSIRSRLLYGFKHFSRIGAWALMVTTLGLEPFTRIAFCVGRRDLAGVRDTLKGYYLLWCAVPDLVQKRHGGDK